jgi:site-specific DNA recombinase
VGEEAGVAGNSSFPGSHRLPDATALQARPDELADQFAEGAIDGSQLRRGTSTLRTKLAAIDSQLADAARIDPVVGLLADQTQLQTHWDAVTPAVRGQIIDQLMTVTVLPCPKGLRRFDPTYVDIAWKAAP